MGDIALFNVSGVLFLFRFLHVFFGIIWIGLLYYFNFVQGAFFAETDGPTKSNAIQKLVPRALWWFRWAAFWTFITGVVQISITAHMGGMAQFSSPYGVIILTGMAFATLMFLNVWLVIWPNQKIVIESATLVAQGKAALPEAAAAAARAGVASRTNTLFSMPMLFLMVGARHLPMMQSESPKTMILAVLLALIIGGLEINALKGKTGPMTSIKGVIHLGLVLTVVVYALMEICK